MVIQEIVNILENKPETVTIVNDNDREEIAVDAYLLSKFLTSVKLISADNLKIIVDEKGFNGIKNFWGIQQQ